MAIVPRRGCQRIKWIRKSRPAPPDGFFGVFSAVFPVEFQGQEDGNGGGDDGQRQQPRQRQRKNRSGCGFGVIDQSAERAYGSKGEKGNENGDPPGLFRAVAKDERYIQI